MLAGKRSGNCKVDHWSWSQCWVPSSQFYLHCSPAVFTGLAISWGVKVALPEAWMGHVGVVQGYICYLFSFDFACVLCVHVCVWCGRPQWFCRSWCVCGLVTGLLLPCGQGQYTPNVTTSSCEGVSPLMRHPLDLCVFVCVCVCVCVCVFVNGTTWTSFERWYRQLSSAADTYWATSFIKMSFACYFNGII